jgi:hypothetical protein
MAAFVLDAGPLVAVDRNDRNVMATLKVAQVTGFELRTNGVVIAQVWHDPAGRQANLARLMKAIDVRAVDGQLGREAGVLLGRAATGDAVDATVVAIAATGDRILTSDPRDIGAVVSAAGRAVTVVRC